MRILGIDTSCDETAAAVVEGRRILSNELFSQIPIHAKWGGVVPNLAKRAHEEKIDSVINSALEKSKTPINTIDTIAVTYGPGLSIALGVGIKKSKEIAKKYNKKLIAVNHMEGHIYSCFAQNKSGKSDINFEFPYLVLLVSGGHTELVLFKDHTYYEILGKTVDDAAGEAIDKGTRLILDNKVYPGGPILEAMSEKGDPKFIDFPRPMARSTDFNFSFSGLKTSLFYALKQMGDRERINNQNNLAASYQMAVIDSLCIKMRQAMKKTGVKNICVAGGVAVNKLLRDKMRILVERNGGRILFPLKGLYGDNAAMIAVAGYFKAQKGLFVESIDSLDRVPRASLDKLEKF